MKKALITILKYVIFLGLGVGVAWYMLYKVQKDGNLDKLLDSIHKSISPPWYLITICFVGFLSHYIRAIRWRYLLETIELRPTVTNTMFAVMIGYITNLVLPRAGEVAKCTVLAKYEGMPAHKMVGTIVAERAFDVVCLLTIAIVTFLLEMGRINSYITKFILPHIKQVENVLAVGLVGFVIALVALVLFYRKNKESKMGLLLKEMTHGIMSIVHMKKKWQFLVLTVLMWLMYTLQIYLGLMSVGANLSLISSMVVLVWGSVALIFVPGGIGLYPWLVSQMLQGPYQIDQITSDAFGWIAWAVQTAVIIMLGVFSLLFIHSYNKKRNAKAAVDPK
jgi:hypothetical protein